MNNQKEIEVRIEIIALAIVSIMLVCMVVYCQRLDHKARMAIIQLESERTERQKAMKYMDQCCRLADWYGSFVTNRPPESIWIFPDMSNRNRKP
jgi:hypothetical protein